MTRSLPARHRTRGITLLEMLVTLVVVALVAGVMTQAMAQLARVEQLLAGGQLRGVATSMRAEWVRSALESLLPGKRDSDGRMSGSDQELRGLSADVPALPAAGLAPLHLRLTFRARTGTTELEMQLPNDAASSPAWVVLLSWAGHEGRFRYLDRSHEWHNQWPPSAALAPPIDSLPVTVALETGLPEVRVLMATPQRVDLPPLPTRAQLERM